MPDENAPKRDANDDSAAAQQPGVKADAVPEATPDAGPGVKAEAMANATPPDALASTPERHAAAAAPAEPVATAPVPGNEPTSAEAVPSPGDVAASGDAAAPASQATPAGAPRESAKADMPPAEVGARLAELFPALFTPGQPKPIKLRIQADIQQRAPGLFTKKALSIFLHRHTTTTAYLKALVATPVRIDLDGAAAGELIAEHREAAEAELARRKSLHDLRRAAERDARRAAGRGAPRAERRAAAAGGGPGGAAAGPAAAFEHAAAAGANAPGAAATVVATPTNADRPRRFGRPDRPGPQAAAPARLGPLDAPARARAQTAAPGEEDGRPQRRDRSRGGTSDGAGGAGPVRRGDDRRPPRRDGAPSEAAPREGRRPRPDAGPQGRRDDRDRRSPGAMRDPAARHAGGAAAPRPAPSPATVPLPDDPVQRERALLLRAFEASTLSRRNFCALKGLREADLDAMLTRAREEATERAATGTAGRESKGAQPRSTGRSEG